MFESIPGEINKYIDRILLEFQGDVPYFTPDIIMAAEWQRGICGQKWFNKILSVFEFNQKNSLHFQANTLNRSLNLSRYISHKCLIDIRNRQYSLLCSCPAEYLSSLIMNTTP